MHIFTKRGSASGNCDFLTSKTSREGFGGVARGYFPQARFSGPIWRNFLEPSFGLANFRVTRHPMVLLPQIRLETAVVSLMEVSFTSTSVCDII
jgi:hypothetical protein